MKDKYQRGKWINYAVRVLMAAAAPVIAVLGDVTFQDLLSKDCGLYKLIKDNRIETIIVLTIIGATATFVYNAIVASREKRVLDEAAESFNEYHMELNNAFFGIRKWYEKNKDQWDKKIEDQITKREAYIDVVQTYSNELCRGINRFFRARYKLDLHVCIKMVDLDSLKEAHASKDVGKVRLFTLARGGSNEKERRDMERQQIILRLGDYIQREVTIFPAEPAEKISDFYTMLRANETPWLVDSESAMGFVSHDMVRYRNRIVRFNKFNKDYIPEKERKLYRRYRTTSGKWWEKYRSTACIPIRIHKGNLDKTMQDQISGSFLIVGFLCIDTASTMNKKLLEQIARYTQGFAETLEGFFSEVVQKNPAIKVPDKEYPQQDPDSKYRDETPTDGRFKNWFWEKRMERVLLRKGSDAVYEMQKKLLKRYANACPDVMVDKEKDHFWKYEANDNDGVEETKVTA